ncbi:hypothetical protein AB3X89_39285, partial [Paraburkholderia sp. BR14320]|uniref:hypothetical protein n=1 Tax=unclassified Paraburkholderia TaxID=2615204 RepID=UPI0034CD265A
AARGRDYREPRESVEQLRQGRLRQKALVASATNCGPTLLNKAAIRLDQSSSTVDAMTFHK